jgi:protein SCO1/2
MMRSRLPTIRPAPEFTLINQHAKPVKLSDYRGKAVLVSFIFTTCNGSCPATTHRLAKVHDALAKEPELHKQVHFVSITLDPARDTPEMLRGYMKLYELDEEHWTCVTGPVKDVIKVHAAWDMWAKPAANGQLDHPSRVFLVDKEGRVREIYNLDFLRIPWVVEDIREVCK